jgi:menaquinone-dependent protoporphyrinogen oxidase
MKPILVLYATREGQTQRIAEHVTAKLREKGLSVELVDAHLIPLGLPLATYSSTILAASVHAGKHEPEMVGFVRRHQIELEQMPAMFLSVSLSQAGTLLANSRMTHRPNCANAEVRVGAGRTPLQ